MISGRYEKPLNVVAEIKKEVPVYRVLLLLLCACSLGVGADSKPERVKDKYQAIEVGAFDIQKGVDFPAELLSVLQGEVIRQLRESKEFAEVLSAGAAPGQADAPVLKVTGTITHFKPGSRKKRYFGGGFGAGAAEVFAQITFSDRATGRVILSENVTGILTSGLGGGATSDVAKQFARQLVDSTKLVGERRLPQLDQFAAGPAPAARPEQPSEANPAPISPPVMDRHTITISSGHLDEAEKNLGDDGAAGYKVIAFALTSDKTADLTLEKTVGSPTYEYTLLHGIRIGGLEKRLNEKGEEGFRLLPQSLVQLRNETMLIAERSSRSGSHYEYKLHQSVLVSSAQKSIDKDEAQGYTLAATSNQVLHLILLEKERAAGPTEGRR